MVQKGKINWKNTLNVRGFYKDGQIDTDKYLGKIDGYTNIKLKNINKQTDR